MSKGGDLQRKLGDLLERAVTLATGRNRPPDLGTVLLGEAERCVIEGPAGPTIPNVFVVAAGEIPEPSERAAIERRLEDHIVEAAVYLGRRFDGPIDVRLAPGGRRPEIETAFAVGDLPAWAVLTAADDDEPVTVHHNRAVIGRSKDGDVIVNRDGVSRKHALLWREAGRVWIADLQSANGTYVNGDPVYDVVEVRRSDLILFGNAGFVFGMA
ncbi:MAG: FHA domain-containing protein [Actinomycetota bacterium]